MIHLLTLILLFIVAKSTQAQGKGEEKKVLRGGKIHKETHDYAQAYKVAGREKGTAKTFNKWMNEKRDMPYNALVEEYNAAGREEGTGTTFNKWLKEKRDMPYNALVAAGREEGTGTTFNKWMNEKRDMPYNALVDMPFNQPLNLAEMKKHMSDDEIRESFKRKIAVANQMNGLVEAAGREKGTGKTFVKWFKEERDMPKEKD